MLLKELNKLMTMHHEANRVHIFMPGGERIGKVNNVTMSVCCVTIITLGEDIHATTV